MAHYVVCPFKEFGARRSPIDKAVRRKLSLLQKAGAVLVDLHAADSLHRLQPGDALLIEGHGWINSDQLFAKAKLEGAKLLDANGLAQRIANARLPLAHRTIAVLSCFSGGELDADAALANDPARLSDAQRYTRFMSNEGAGTLARWLAIALGDRHYGNVAVSGYRGEVITSKRHFKGLRVRTRYHRVQDPFGYHEPVESAADPARRTFDARGHELMHEPDPLAGLDFT